jgi:hypothetical protein
MGILRGAVKTKLTTKAALIAAGVVVIGGGAAIASPSVSLTGTQQSDEDVVDDDVEVGEVAPEVVEVDAQDDDPADLAAYCEEHPEDPACEEAGEDAENAEAFSTWAQSVPSEWGCVRGQLVSHAASQGPHGDHIDELDFATAEEAAAYLADVREDPGFLDRTCVANVLGAAEEDEEETADEAPEDEALEEDETEGSAEAFSTWVRSVPSEWGCIRGQLISSVAGNGHHDADFDELTFDSAEEAANHLAEQQPGFLDRRCVEVAIARDGGPSAADDEDVDDAPDNGNGNGNGNGAANGNGNGNGNGAANGNGNGAANGNSNGNGAANGNGNGNGAANGNGNGNG